MDGSTGASVGEVLVTAVKLPVLQDPPLTIFAALGGTCL